MTTKKRDVTVTTSLGTDVLLCAGMSGTEEMSRPFEYVVDLLTQDEGLELHKLVGQPMTVHLTIAAGKKRSFNGLVSRIAYTGSDGDYNRYRAIVKPWVWTLTRRSDCRVFQDMTVPDIVKDVFRDAGFSDFEEKLGGTYVERGYCVQYRETDFAFVSRLLEDEGIYYYFVHEDGKHTLVMADSINAHAPFDGHANMKFFPPGRSEAIEEPHIFAWDVAHEYQSNIFAHTDYDFIEPTKDLVTNASIPRGHTRAEFEVYDYPGGYTEAEAGETLARIRIEELQAGYERCNGDGNVPGVAVGHLFTLGNHPRGDQNREYLVLACRHTLTVAGYESKGAGGGEPSYECAFTVQPSGQAYRPPRITPKPGVRGPQTATVVGPDGETVWCDEYGRIKIQFHWDRVGEVNENSSCWVRVSQPSAGSTWGGMFLPHIGQEVIVDFLEGDPGQPIVTGRVYNGDNMPPLALPDNKHKSIIRDHFGNEIIFDGTAGQEHIKLQSGGDILRIGASPAGSAPSPSGARSVGSAAATPHVVPTGYTQFTRNDNTSYSYGDAKSYNYGDSRSYSKGNSYEVTRGSSFGLTLGSGVDLSIGAAVSGSIGAAVGVSVGPEIGVTMGTKLEVGWTNTFSWTQGEYRRTSNDEIILDSKKPCIMTGGDPDRSIFIADVNYLTMAYDPTPPPQAAGYDRMAKVVALLTAATIGTLSALQSNSYKLPDNLPDEYKSDDGTTDQHDYKLGEFDSWSKEDGYSIGIAAATVIGSALSLLLSAKQSTPHHDNPSAQIKVSHDQFEVFTGQGIPGGAAAPGVLPPPSKPGPDSSLLRGVAKSTAPLPPGVSRPPPSADKVGWLMKTPGFIDFEAGAGTPTADARFTVKIKNVEKLSITDTDFKVLGGLKVNFNAGALKIDP